MVTAIPKTVRPVDHQRLSILGATGSIGQNVAEIVEQHRDRFAVEAVAGGTDAAALAAMARRLGAKFAAIHDEGAYADLKQALAGSGIACGAGGEAVVEAAIRQEADMVIGAIVGAAGLKPTMAAIEQGKIIALANKECLVSAGTLFMAAATKYGAEIRPVDSEHSAVLQALDGSPLERIRQVVLTASGGPFLTWSRGALTDVTPTDALKHPTWSMGAKVTIDSATLMNKGLELIEAHHLFGLPAEKLGALIQPQSIVHALVAYVDGSVMAHLGTPDMRTPIAYALGYPKRLETPVAPLDLAALGELRFETPDHDRFPAINLAMAAMRAGDGAMTVLNAANEVAVAAFLEGRIGFLAIAEIVSTVLERYVKTANLTLSSLDDVVAVDAQARYFAAEAMI